MPLGLINTPAMFMQTINNPFFDILDSSMVVFLHDIIVYSNTMREHFILLKKVLAHLYQYALYWKFKKCSFLYNGTMFLGFDITSECMRISDSKVQSLNKWPVPTAVK